MTTDPYSVLGVSRSATDKDIQKAFRVLAKKLHPDLNPGDAAAAERFKKVSQAYDILGDAEKRRQFDAGEIDASGEPRHTYAGAGGFQGYRPRGAGPADDMGFGDVFSDLFGGRRGSGGFSGGFSGGGPFQAGPARGQDIRYTLDIDFLESVSGARKRVSMPGGSTLDLNVPEGVEDGRILRLKGKGRAGDFGGTPGDALIEIKVQPHKQFARDGDDVRLELPISIDEAVLGAKIEVPTVSGPVNLTIPKGTSSGQTFRLRGKGVKNATTGAKGDQFVLVKIVLPDEIDDGLAYYLTEWRQTHGYNPRR
ncbi:MAG: DnaJ C-terminal domain-containing protein [Hyphomicrobiaceae bacterium]